MSWKVGNKNMDNRICFTKQIAQKTFKGATTKEAYLTAVKWYASNIIARDELHEIQVEFIKGINQVTLKLYAVLQEQVVRENHCEICKEMHKSFFVNEATNCNSCKMLAYQKRLEQKMSVKSQYYKELLRKIGE